MKAYYAFFYSHISYGTMLWGSASKIKIGQIFKLQKCALRVMLKIPQEQTCRGNFKKLGLLTLTAVYIYQCICLVRKQADNLMTNEGIHSHFTRDRRDYRREFYRGNFSKNNPLHIGCDLHNKLPNEIKKEKCDTKFKNMLKNCLLELEPYTLEEFYRRNVWSSKYPYMPNAISFYSVF